jgi:hypothetical protein
LLIATTAKDKFLYLARIFIFEREGERDEGKGEGMSIIKNINCR